MKRTVIIAAALLIGTAASAFAAQKGGASQLSPGHEMQSSGAKGASEFSPGDQMRDSRERGTVGQTKGASEYSPGDRMNDRRKK